MDLGLYIGLGRAWQVHFTRRVPPMHMQGHAEEQGKNVKEVL